MKKKLWQCLALLLCAVLMLGAVPAVSVSAQETDVMAKDISSPMLVKDKSVWFYSDGLFDDLPAYVITVKADTSFTLESPEGIASLYFLFEEAYGEFTVTDVATGEEKVFGGNGFINEFADLEGAFGRVPEAVRLCFPGRDALINEIYAFTFGQVPAFVQRWEPPVEQEADLVLFSTHCDDDQIFFAGILPWYAAELGYNVQVVYMTNHPDDTFRRVHEMLNGLWAVGVKTYPVIGTFPDLYSTNLSYAYQRFREVGIGEEELLEFVVEQLRRFRPKVAVGHDLKGEYGHGMHMVYSDLLCKALEIADDPDVFPELAEKYGVWDVPKTYLHLYPENTIHMNWDIPMESFGGKTAYEVSRDLGFPCHASQVPVFSWYFRGGPKAENVPQYSCCDYGLYRSTVGEDVEKQDFFENLTTHAEDAVLEAERLAAEEAERIAREEAEAAAREEEARRQEQALLEAAQQTEAPQMEETEPEKRDVPVFAVLILTGIAVFGIVILLLTRTRKKKSKKFLKK